MKIAQVVCSFPPYKGGIGNSVYHFSKELALLGHDVTVFTPRYPGEPTEPDCAFPGFRVVRLRPLLSFGNAAVLPQIRKHLNGFDIVHLHYPFYGTAGLAVLPKICRPSTKILLYYHMDNKADGIRGLVFRCYRYAVLPVILRLADEITCSSLDYIEHSEVGSYYRRQARKFYAVPYGVESDFFSPARETQKSERKVILFVGALNKQGYFKGVDNLIMAFERIKPRYPDCILRIVGRGDREDRYRSLAAELGVLDSVEFVNDADDKTLVEHYQSSCLLVLPSLDASEAFGIVLLEAMACAKPVVASNLPGVRSVFENGKHGLLVRPGDVGDLVEKICLLLDDESMARNLGTAGRHHVEKEYSWALSAKKLDRIYHRVGSTAGSSASKGLR